MHSIVREWISEVLESRLGPVQIATRQRAKFEGWLKFELAAHAEKRGAREVRVEAPLSTSNRDLARCDIAFSWNGTPFAIELKTPNTNWRMLGVENRSRPITKNISSIVSDANKLIGGKAQGLVAFVLFPIPCGDARWRGLLETVAQQTEIAVTADNHATQLTLPLSANDSVDVVVCCFPVPR